MAIETITLGALLLGGGALANTYVQNKRANSLSRNTSAIFRQAKQKQAELDEQRQQTLGQALNEAAVGRNEVEDRQREQAARRVERAENNSRREQPEQRVNPANGPAGRVIDNAVSAERETNDAESSQRRAAAAKLDSLGAVLAENSRIFRPAQGEINANQQIARGEEARIPLAIQAAREDALSKGRKLEIAAQIAKGVGSGLLASGGGGSGALFGGGGAGAGAVSGGTGSAVTTNTVGSGVGTKLSRPARFLF